MSLYLIAAVGLIFIAVSFKRKNPEEEAAPLFDRNFTTVMKGFCILMMVVCHLYKTNVLEGAMAYPLLVVGGIIDQIAVAPYFLFSGFGIMLGFMHKGRGYTKSIFIKHILIFFAFTAIFLLPYYIRDFVLNGFNRPWYYYLEVLIGVETLGNYGWFIYVISICYLSSIVAGLLPFKKDIYRAITVAFFCLIYFVLMASFGFQSFHYDTVLAFPIGMIIALYQEKIKAFFTNKKRTLTIFIICTTIYVLISFLYLVIDSKYEALVRVPKLFLFIIGTLCYNRYYTFHSKVGYFLGLHTWPIFLLHKFPLVLLEGVEMSQSLYYIVAFASIVGISAIGILIEIFAKKLIAKMVVKAPSKT